MKLTSLHLENFYQDNIDLDYFIDNIEEYINSMNIKYIVNVGYADKVCWKYKIS